MEVLAVERLHSYPPSLARYSLRSLYPVIINDSYRLDVKITVRVPEHVLSID